MKVPAMQGGPELPIHTEEEASIAELIELARRIKAWQELQPGGLSNNKLVERYPGLGSSKTYSAIAAGKTSDYDVERQLVAYRGVWQQINEELPDAKADAFYDDLGTVNKVRLAALEARTCGDNTRFVLVEGDTGCGKTKTLEGLVAKYKETVLIEASAAWKDSPNALLTELAVAMGDGKGHASQSQRLREVKALLVKQRRIICIDEGHEMGPRCLNTLRTLINGSQCVFVVAAMHTLWERLEKKDAYQEARQLTGNRLQRRVKLHKVSETDVKRLLVHIAGIEGDPTEKDKDGASLLTRAARHIIPDCARHGHLKLATRVARSARRLAGDDAVTLEHIAAAKAEELDKR